jgi:hypothetical protein
MSQQTLLIETLNPSESNMIAESTTDGKTLYLNGIMMQSQIKNRNGRIYPINEISGAVKSANDVIKSTRGIMGELDHPETLTVNLQKVSHVITEMKMVGNNAIGKAKLLDTPMGMIGKELVKSGVALGFSSRGAGNVNEQGLVEGFNFITVDIVATPSAQNAYPSAVYESLEHSKNYNEIMSLSEAVKHDPRAQEYFKKEILNWIKNTTFTKK